MPWYWYVRQREREREKTSTDKKYPFLSNHYSVANMADLSIESINSRDFFYIWNSGKN